MIADLLVRMPSGIADDVLGGMDLALRIVPHPMMPFHAMSGEWVRNAMSRTGMKQTDLLDCLDTLFINRMLVARNTLGWCENCGVENPVVTEIQGSISPSKLLSAKCLVCGKPLAWNSIFDLDKALRDAIFVKDGLLAVYFGWALSQRELPFSVSADAGTLEKDFIVADRYVIEVKMYRGEKGAHAKDSSLNTALSGLQRSVVDLKNNGKEIKGAYLLWNQKPPKGNTLKDKKRGFPELFQHCDFAVFSHDQIDDLMERLGG